MSNGWTPERRQRQSEMIKQWKPWEKSTGPRTEAGKQISAVNAVKYSNFHDQISCLVQLLTTQATQSNNRF
jgi:hypothetical protein